MSAATSPRAYTVIYDGDCAVCGKLVALLAKWDHEGKLEILPAQAVDVRTRFPWIPAGAMAESMQVVRASDRATWQGAAGVEQLLGALPRGRWISWMFAVPLVRRLAERGYRWFARNRYRLGCGRHCRVRHDARPG